MQSVESVANTVLQCAEVNGDKIDQQRLQRLLFFVDGWSMCQLGSCAFPEKIAKTKFGPVVKSIYKRCIPHGSSSINEKRFGDGKIVDSSEDLRGLIEAVYRTYGTFSTSDLNAMIISLEDEPFTDSKYLFSTIKNTNTYYSQQKMKTWFKNINRS